MFGFLQRVIPIMFDQLVLERDWLYSPIYDGLTWVGALVVATVSAGVSVLYARFGGQVRESLSGGPRREGSAISPLWLIFGGLAALALLAAPLLLGSVVSEVLGSVMVFALLGIGLNIVVGYAGLLDLGYVFFFALGAYSLALLTGATLNAYGIPPEPVISGSLNFYVAIPIVMLIAAAAGVLVGAPVLRLRGDYLALVTLGLGEMVTVLIASPWLVPLVGGPSGMRGITDAAIGGISFRDPQNFYYLALAFVAIAAFVSWRLAASRIGRAWTAMREDEQTADAMGISTTRFKLLAFAIGGAIGSLGGALFAVKIGSLTPASFQVLISIQVLGIVILGGMGSIPGVLVGALVLVGLPGLLREFEEYRLLAYGAAVVAVMILRPQGLIPNVRRSRELQDEERAAGRMGENGEGRRDPWRGRHGHGGRAVSEPPSAAGSDVMLEIRGLQKHFGGLYALSGLDMVVRRGEIVSVIGPNGAGKSTLFNVITGIYEPDAGDIVYQGLSVVGLRPFQLVKLGVARTFQNVRLFPNMTILENAMVGQHCRSQGGVFGSIIRTPGVRTEEARIRQRAEEALSFFGKRLSGYRLEQPAFSLSYANRRRLEMARAMATDPQVLLLDEPTAGMNPRETLELRDHIVRMRDELGLTVVVIEHDMRVVKGVSDRVIACDYGQKIAEGTYEEVANDERVIEAYLGTKAAG